jgi:hypothetical protein
MRIAIVCLVVGCGPPPKRAPSNTVPAPATLPDWEGRCHEMQEQRLDERRTAELVLCTTAGSDFSYRSDPKKSRTRAAHLVMRAGTRVIATRTLATWSDGYEWGSEWSLEGALRADANDDDAVILVSEAQTNADHRETRLRVFRPIGAGWLEVHHAMASTIRVTPNPDQHHAVVVSCNDGFERCDDAQGLGGPHTLEKWSWDGVRVRVQ